ncbi:hypothetical protein [Aestuariibaculum sediminum]|uniref:Uncharacterized protein n=1 Tax=Aestuariibaculum sediminum TaxID=2770637 RepID=A0A8J6Q8H3_9FLAO|nr:hypothetical protein [Aestuariibaculum sediminum]MBD0831582.1 hypothetical protein [Aestuariibaculum sediminum]
MIKSQLVSFSLVLLTFTGCISNNKNPNKENNRFTETFKFPDSISAKRISFVLDLRNRLAEKYWHDFANKKAEGTFIYFNGTCSEIFFPSKQVLNKLKTYKTFSEDYVLSPRTDSIPYHFELMIAFDSSQADKFYFKHPVQQFLSVEEIGAFIPSIKSTEMWATLVIHEMFHHFQYNNLNFKNYAESIASLNYDIRNLIKLGLDDPDFSSAIQKENELLLKAIDANNEMSIIQNITTYFNERKKRLEAYKSEHPLMEKVENFYTLQEGSARYMEYQCAKELSEFAINQPDSLTLTNDPKFNSFKAFENISLNHHEFSWMTYADASTYHYAIGFNLMRLFDKLGINYKKNLFDNSGYNLHFYLESYLKKYL